MEPEYSWLTSMEQRLAARQVARQKRAELEAKLRTLEAASSRYTRLFGQVKNFSNRDWRQLIRDPQRFAALKVLLGRDWLDLANRAHVIRDVLRPQ